MTQPPTVSHTHVLHVRADEPALALLEQTITGCGGQVVPPPFVRRPAPEGTVAVGFRAASAEHAADIVSAAAALDGTEIAGDVDVVLDRHEGGKLRIRATSEVRDLVDLAYVYTPGVARPCLEIAEDPERAYELTIKRNSVAIISDGSAVLGLGDIGPLAAMPVMEGKAILLRDLAGVDAYPICLDERDPDRLVDMIAALSTGFGGINLEDISAPRCFEVEGKLRQRLDIPVFHDDQHGTAVVVLAALINAVAVVGKTLGPDLRVVVQGIGAAGIAVANLLMAAGVVDLVGVDRDGIVTARRKEARDPIFRRFGKQTNPRDLKGEKAVALQDADVFIGLSAGNTLSPDELALMADDAVVFAMANPTPEIDPVIARERAAVVATGRSDFPNQINNVLCFPGLFRGLLDARASTVNDEVKLAAARAIAGIVTDDERGPDHIIPSPLDRRVVPAVAQAVARAAAASGAARTLSACGRRSRAVTGQDDRPAIIAAQVEALTPVDAREVASRVEVLRGLRDLPRPFDQDAASTHVTGSAVVVGPRGTVLHRHKRLGLWLQPGGHLDAGEWPHDAAVRETVEETGLEVTHPQSGPVLIHVDAHDGGRGHRHLDLRYLLLAGPADPAPPAGESPDCRWFSWADAAAIADPGLVGALQVARRVTGN